MDPDYLICNGSYLPSSKQYFSALGSSFTSSVLIIGGLITLGLFILFFELVVYTNSTAHREARGHIIWITSVFPVMTFLSLVSLIIPRADYVCISVKMVYMSIGISHFTDLTMVMFGGEELFVERARGEAFNLRLAPLCCCCRCLPNAPVTKYSHRVVALLTDQLPFIQAAYYVIVSILLSADNIKLGDLQPTGPLLWLNMVKITSVLAGVYGFKILSYFSRDHLDDFDYWRKSRSINILLLITNFQTMIFNVLLNYGVFPCHPPYLSPSLYKQTIDNGIYLLEMMILGPYTFYQYHDQKFSSPINRFELYRNRNNESRNNSVSVASVKDSNPDTVSTTVSIAAAGHHSSDSEDEHSRNSSGGEEGVITAENWNSRNSSIRESRSRYSKGNGWNEDRVEIEREKIGNTRNGWNGDGIRDSSSGGSSGSRSGNMNGARSKDRYKANLNAENKYIDGNSGSNSSNVRYKEGLKYKDKYKGEVNTDREVSGPYGEGSSGSGSGYKESIRYKDDKYKGNVNTREYREGCISGSGGSRYKEGIDSGCEMNVGSYNVGRNINNTTDITNNADARNDSTYKTTNTTNTATTSTDKATNNNNNNLTTTNKTSNNNSSSLTTTNIATNTATNTHHHTSLLDKARSLTSHTAKTRNEYERF